MLVDVIWAAAAIIILFGGVGVALVWYELVYSAIERRRAEQQTQQEREAYARWAESRKALQRDLII